MRGLRLWIVGLAAIIVIIAGAFLTYSSVFSQASHTPEQPIRFPHIWHVQSVGLECDFCHRTASTSDGAGIPAVAQCMFCHQVAGHESPEVQKLLKANSEGKPINWARVFWVPDFVRFSHAPHVQANVSCSVCHGDVASMTVAERVRVFKMNDCVDCHRQQNAPADCWICHY